MDNVEKIKQKIDITDLISEYITIQKAGQNFKAICPFHGEKTPSFVISPERQVWHCFGCQRGGDHFSFIEEIEGIDFSEALKLLAEKAGVKLTSTPFKTKREQEKNTLYEINHLASQYYSYILTRHPAGKKAYEYLSKERKLNDKLINTFMLGYAPSTYNSLTNYLLKKKGYERKSIIDAGIATEKNGRIFDFFRNRIIFPIFDPRKNIIGFSGRALDDNTPPKYINTRETLIYKKTYSLYGIHFTKDYIKKQGKVILMEGEFDVLSSIANGISNVVAIKGTALTEEQINLLKRYTKKIVFCFDTDSAGIAAQKRSIQLIEEEGIASSVVVPPHGKDPDELLRENPAEFKSALKNEIGVYDFIIKSAIKEEDAKTIEGKRNILDKTLPFLHAIDNEIIKEHYIKQLASSLDTSFESVATELSKIPITLPKKQLIQSKEPQSREENLELHLLSLIFQSKNPYESLTLTNSLINEEYFESQSFKKVYEALKKYFETNNAFDQKKFANILPPELLDAFNLTYIKPLPKFESDTAHTKELERTIFERIKLTLKKKLQTLGAQIKKEEQENNEQKVEILQQEFSKTAEELKKIITS